MPWIFKGHVKGIYASQQDCILCSLVSICIAMKGIHRHGADRQTEQRQGTKVAIHWLFWADLHVI